MIGAMLARVLRRQAPPLVLIGGTAFGLFLWTYTIWPLPVWAGFWALVLVVLLVLASVFDLGERGEDR